MMSRSTADMTCQDIYNGALALLGEDVSGDQSDDYYERAPYLIEMVCSAMAELDRIFRMECGREPPTVTERLRIELDEEFPLSPEFAVAAAFYLASLFVIDSDFERSNLFFDNYDSAASGVMRSLTFTSESIVNKYPR